MEWLKGRIFDEEENAQSKSEELTRELFGREPESDEFVPVSPAYRYLAKSIMAIDNPDKKKEVERMLEKPKVFLRAARRYGLVTQNGGHYSSK